MENVAKLIEDATNSALTPDALKDTVDKKVNGAIDSVLESMFRSYGDVFKQIEKQLAAKINVDLSHVSLPEYNVMVTDMVVQAANRAMQTSMGEHLAKELDEIFSPAPAEITVNKLIDPFIASWRESNLEHGAYPECDDYATCEVEKSQWGSYTLNLWSKRRSAGILRHEDSRDRRPDLSLYISEEGKIRIIRDDDGANIKFSNFATTSHDGFAHLYQMYAAGTVVSDIGDVNTDHLDLCLTHED